MVGQQPGDLAPEPDIDALLPSDVDAAFDAAQRDNAQVRQADYAEAATAARLAEAKAQTRPTVNLTGSYGYVSTSSGFSGGLSGSSSLAAGEQERGGTIAIQANAPIFTGGLTSSGIRQAAAQDDVAEAQVQAAQRSAIQQTAQAWNQLLGARAALGSDQEQVKSDAVAFDGVSAEQKVGLRTVLDVLNAQQELETSQLTLVTARHDAYVAETAVLAATGRLDPRDFAPAERPYDPKANFDHVRHAIGWVPWEGAVGAIDHLGAPQPVDRTPPPSEEQAPVATGGGDKAQH